MPATGLTMFQIAKSIQFVRTHQMVWCLLRNLAFVIGSVLVVTHVYSVVQLVLQ